MLPGTCGATGTVQVVLVVRGGVVVDHDVDVVHVDAASRDVGRDKGLEFAGGEVRQRLLTHVLAQVAVDGRGRHAQVLELAGQAIRSVLGVREDHRATRGLRDRRRDLRLVHLVHVDEAVRHVFDGRTLGLDLVTGRVLLVPAHERVDRTVERRREEQGLVADLDVAQDPLDLGQEPHVGHAVGLVDDDVLDVEHRQVATFDQVDRPTRRADRQVHAALQCLDLLVDGVAAVDRHDPHAA